MNETLDNRSEIERNLERISFLGISLMNFIEDLPKNIAQHYFEDSELIALRNDIYQLYKKCEEDKALFPDQKIHNLELRAQKFLDAYKTRINGSVEKQGNIYGQETYKIFFEVSGALRKLLFRPHLNCDRELVNDLLIFFETHFSDIEDNKPIDPKTPLQKNILAAINIILTNQPNEILPAKTVQRLTNYRSSIQ